MLRIGLKYFGMNLSRLMSANKAIAMAKSNSFKLDGVDSLVSQYCVIVEKGLFERWGKLDIELYDSEIYEVVGGLLARQSTLAIQFAKNPHCWSGHLAPIILRSMIDAHITFAWILKDLKDRANKYILYGLGQTKLFIEHLRAALAEDPNDELIKSLIKTQEAWLNSQRLDLITEVDVGSWSGKTVLEMAKDAGCESLFHFAYTPFSGVAHNMWQHVSLYNLKHCRNPLHKYHRIPIMADVPLDIDFLIRSAKYTEYTFSAFDQAFNIQVESPMPLTWLEHNLPKIKFELAK